MAGQNVVKMAVEYKLPDLVMLSIARSAETVLYQVQRSREFYYSAC